MADLILNSTPGDPEANSYITLEEADQFAQLYPGEDFAASWLVNLDEQTRIAYCIRATNLIEQTVSWYYTSEASTQSLNWPCANVPRKGQLASTPEELADILPAGTIPRDVRDATAYLALQLVNSNPMNAGAVGIKSLGLGDLSIDYADNAPVAPVLDRQATTFIRKWGTAVTDEAEVAASANGLWTGQVVRGYP